MKYGVRPSTSLTVGWEIFHRVRNETHFIHVSTEAEASIIAFALNAVANGNTLIEERLIDNGHGTEIVAEYDGPTEGIAP